MGEGYNLNYPLHQKLAEIIRSQNMSNELFDKLPQVATGRRYYYGLGLRAVNIILEEGWQIFFRKAFYYLKYRAIYYYKRYKNQTQLLNLNYFYFKNYEKKILSSRPILCDRSNEYEIHMLLCDRDVLNAIWCLKTFYYYSSIKTRLVIHDDGTLTDNALYQLSKHFVGCEIIRKEDADIEMRKYLEAYPFCSKYRLSHNKNGQILSIKLFDFLFFSKTKKILCLDSDILFFNKPIEIVENMKHKTGFFMSDYIDAYSLPVDELNNKLGIILRNKVNSGLYFFPKLKYYDLDLMEFFLRIVFECHKTNLFFREQTGIALLVSKYADAFVRLPECYQISRTRITKETISHHFVSDGSRINFHIQGLKRLKQTGFLREFKKATTNYN